NQSQNRFVMVLECSYGAELCAIIECKEENLDSYLKKMVEINRPKPE
ncbi:MAG: hypothetical protein RL497_2411, partial [Pseudomonadota bacterium]